MELKTQTLTIKQSTSAVVSLLFRWATSHHPIVDHLSVMAHPQVFYSLLNKWDDHVTFPGFTSILWANLFPWYINLLNERCFNTSYWISSFVVYLIFSHVTSANHILRFCFINKYERLPGYPSLLSVDISSILLPCFVYIWMSLCKACAFLCLYD